MFPSGAHRQMKSTGRKENIVVEHVDLLLWWCEFCSQFTGIGFHWPIWRTLQRKTILRIGLRCWLLLLQQHLDFFPVQRRCPCAAAGWSLSHSQLLLDRRSSSRSESRILHCFYLFFFRCPASPPPPLRIDDLLPKLDRQSCDDHQRAIVVVVAHYAGIQGKRCAFSTKYRCRRHGSNVCTGAATAAARLSGSRSSTQRSR